MLELTGMGSVCRVGVVMQLGKPDPVVPFAVACLAARV